MSWLVNLTALLAGLFVIGIVFRLIVKKRLTESQSVLWLFIGGVIVIFGLFPPLVPLLADFLGIWYPPTILFGVAFIGLLFIVFNNSISLSEYGNKIQELSMQVTLLKEENDRLKKSVEALDKEGVEQH